MLLQFFIEIFGKQDCSSWFKFVLSDNGVDVGDDDDASIEINQLAQIIQ